MAYRSLSRTQPVRSLVMLLVMLLIVTGCGQQDQATVSTRQTAAGAPAETQAAATLPAATSIAAETAASTITAPATAATESATTAAETTRTAAPVAAAAETPVTEATAETTASVPAGGSEGMFQNPVVANNFPDPGVINVDGTYYAYATMGNSRNVQVAQSQNLVEWKELADAMPSLASWVRRSAPDVWAPEVAQVGDKFVLYYTARDAASKKQCIGVATSERPEGPFKDPSEQPFVCQVDQGGTIDASPFNDGDKWYLLFKNDGNCCGRATYLYIQELTPDGQNLVGEPVRLVRNDKGWEGRVVEAPTMWKQDDKYYLFYSANDYAGLQYAVGYATCEAALGPCQDAPENPILETALKRPPVIGPGHQTIVVDDDGEPWIVYHAWEITSTGDKTDRRFMWIDPLVFENGKPIVKGPTTEPQPVP